MNRILRYILFSLVFLTLGLFIGFRLDNRLPGGELLGSDPEMKKFHEALDFVRGNYVEAPDEGKLVSDAIKGMMEGLDPHSFYIPAQELAEMNERMEGSFDGIGVQFNVLDDTIYVEAALAGGPSEKVGIMAGDRIIWVNDTLMAGVGITNTQVMKRLKGPKGTRVRAQILRRGQPDLLEFVITRDKIPLNSVEYSYMINEGTGYLRVTSFTETTYDEFREHLRKLQALGMKSLVLDLRGNPGGYMNMACKMADEFLPAGKVIVSTDGRIPESKQEYKATDALNAFEKGALVVLIDYGSASASEIVSGAVQDHDRGLIVGVRSFGKGMVQIQKAFEDGSAVRMVISKYYTPSGRCIQKPYQKTAAEYEQEIAERFRSGEIFDESKISFPDSLKYKTASGRTVYGGGGIYPDVFVADDTTGGSKYFSALRTNDLFRRFTSDYADRHPDLKTEYADAGDFVRRFTVTPELVRAFGEYGGAHGTPFSQTDYETSQKYIDNRIKAFLGRRLFNDDAFYPVIHQTDRVLQEAIRLTPAASELELSGKLPVIAKQ
ncbi:MAG: peptidase S41 [Bacteroidetes bacterium]|nr:MAG: peptidase S41 [Bacteroidota bacterium]